MMEKFTSIIVLFVTCMVFFVATMPSEPICSKFDYEMKTLEAMLRTERKVEQMLLEFKTVQDSVSKDLNDQITKIKSELELVTNYVDLQNSKNVVIAFSVRNPTKSMVNNVPTFKETITNIGGAYNMDTGVFTSPVDGLYMFVFTVGSSGKYDVYCRIRHNNVNQVFTRTYSDNTLTTASNSVFLSLSKGDTVTLGGCARWEHVYTGNYATTFSGALIKQTS